MVILTRRCLLLSSAALTAGCVGRGTMTSVPVGAAAKVRQPAVGCESPPNTHPSGLRAHFSIRSPRSMRPHYPRTERGGLSFIAEAVSGRSPQRSIASPRGNAMPRTWAVVSRPGRRRAYR
jgi:hypothetical protein